MNLVNPYFYNFNPLNFNPLSLNPSIWLDATDLSTITKDSSNFVSSWADKSGNGNDVVQPVGSEQPLFSNNAIVFDGVDDFLNLTTTISPLPFWTSFSVQKKRVSGVPLVSIAGGLFYTYYDFSDNNVYVYGKDAFTTGVGAESTNKILGAATFSNSNIQIFKNKTSIGSGYTPQAAVTDSFLYIGRQGNAMSDGEIHEVLFYPSILSIVEINKVSDYLNAKYGIF